ncbi:uncharacterized protein [Aristolochia californica]|uniref:uncharacterized protein n=1 Tax=Aristolochia californica TaxID=171875 RepID=UPI0035D8380B
MICCCWKTSFQSSYYYGSPTCSDKVCQRERSRAARRATYTTWIVKGGRGLDSRTREGGQGLAERFRSASELHRAGIMIKKKDEWNSVMDIKFIKGTGILSLPRVNLYRSDVMVAFERLHPGAGHEISAYIEFIASLAQRAEDVSLLLSEGIIYTDLPNNEKVVELLQKLRHDLISRPKTCYEELRNDMEQICRAQVQLKERQIANTMKADTIVDMSRQEMLEEWGECSIYRIPTYIRNKNPEAYTPNLVSFGPYHYGAPHLMPMEKHNHRALSHVLRRSRKTFEDYAAALRPMTLRLMKSYSDLDDRWTTDPDKFLQLMVIDGIFFIEINRVYHGSDPKFQFDYCDNDPMFRSNSSSNPFPLIDLSNDQMLLENQLPHLLIDVLFRMSKSPREDHNIGLLYIKHESNTVTFFIPQSLLLLLLLGG